MATKYTKALANQLTSIGASPVIFSAEFDDWKARCAISELAEFENFLFGKDGAYASPKVNSIPYQLRHVHLVPLKDAERISLWKKFFKLKKRKTSNRVLVYASTTNGDHLLIYILDEPDAHKIAEMTTSDDKTLMKQLATIAADFLHDGTISA